MSNWPLDEAASRERLSALVDGELDGAESIAACAEWRRDAEVRRDWHSWQLIGDVLRSDDLASAPDHDARFLAAVRERLSAEPVVLAPSLLRASTDSAPKRAKRWLMPAGVAAGFMLVIGAAAVLQPGAFQTPAAPAPVALADSAARAPVPPAARRAVAAVPAEPETAVVATGKLIRDAQLDRYLAAHKQFAGTSALGLPSAFLRSATVESAATR